VFPSPQAILPALWDTAVDLFDASRAGVVSDRKRTQKVQEKVRGTFSQSARVSAYSLSENTCFVMTARVYPPKQRDTQKFNGRTPPLYRFFVQVMNKYLKRKYRELKMYVKNGWWGYARPAPRSGRQDGTMSEGMKVLSRRFVFRDLKVVKHLK